ncbi:MAG TPA: class I adenylate-forming enzyme family protein [Candidatus Polarisedimenticolaceae bacterium]|nr:class I adenylate-forming enzyme family protein [Candidatus Polarisedimenticolaceae bacterium]
MRRDPLVEAFDRLVKRRTGPPIVVSQRGSVTPVEIDRAARSIGRLVRDTGIDPGAPLGVVAGNGAGFLAILLAGLRLGHAPILIDRQVTDLELHRVLERLDAGGHVRCVAAFSRGTQAFRIERRSRRTRDRLHTRSPAVIKLTSGSTGSPRGILTSTEALLSDDEALDRSMEIRSSDRLLAAVPFSHSYGLSSLVLPALVRGAPLVVPEPTGIFAPLEAARDFGATIFPTVPAYLAALLRVSGAPPLVDSVRRVISAGARLMPEVAAGFRERFGRGVHAFYGASECGGIAYDPTGTAAERETVGTPVSGVRVDLEAVDGLPADRCRRIVVRSPAVADGYLPDRDARLGGGLFVSDDLGVRRDDELALVGRLNRLINVRGNKVDPTEVERVISELSVVDEVRVVGVVNEKTGDHRVSVVVACRPGAVSPDEIRAWCRGRLSGFKLPRSIHVLERIPRDERGKVDRASLARLARASSPRPKRG